MNETDATQQPITESRTFELFRIERREYTDMFATWRESYSGHLGEVS